MDGLAQCPYDPSHRIIRERLAFHLVRCRNSIRDNDPRRFRQLQRTLATCRFNSCHVVGKENLDEHERDCGDRNSGGDVLEWTPCATKVKEEEEEEEEDWDKECGGGSFVYDGGLARAREADKPFIVAFKNMCK